MRAITPSLLPTVFRPATMSSTPASTKTQTLQKTWNSYKNNILIHPNEKARKKKPAKTRPLHVTRGTHINTQNADFTTAAGAARVRGSLMVCIYNSSTPATDYSQAGCTYTADVCILQQNQNYHTRYVQTSRNSPAAAAAVAVAPPLRGPRKRPIGGSAGGCRSRFESTSLWYAWARRWRRAARSAPPERPTCVTTNTIRYERPEKKKGGVGVGVRPL